MNTLARAVALLSLSLAFVGAHAQVDTSKRADEEAAVKGSPAPGTWTTVAVDG